MQVIDPRNAMATAPNTAQAASTTTFFSLPNPRKPFSTLLLLSIPILLLLLLSLLFLLPHTTFGLLLCPLLLQEPPVEANATTPLHVHLSKNEETSHASSPPPPKRNQRSSSSRRNRDLLKALLLPTARSRRFGARAAELLASPCAPRFFMTWLSPLPQFGRRELLAVESLFRAHRNACLLVVSDAMDTAGGEALLRAFVGGGFRVAAAAPDFGHLLGGTPAEAWLDAARRGDVALGAVPLGQNLSNLLRLAVLYKYGGVYLDADVLVLGSFAGLRNAIGAQAVDAATGDWTRLNNAVMVFDRGHPLLRRFIAEFAATFDGSRWGHNGPYLVSRVVSRLRRRPGLDVAVLPPKAFYPVDWSKIGGLFHAPRGGKEERWVKAKVDRIRRESLAIHLWNRGSRKLEVEEGSVIGKLISDTCLFCNSSLSLPSKAP